jgi:hypothetical protein
MQMMQLWQLGDAQLVDKTCTIGPNGLPVVVVVVSDLGVTGCSRMPRRVEGKQKWCCPSGVAGAGAAPVV